MKTKQKQIKKSVSTRTKVSTSKTLRAKKAPLHARVKGHAKHVLVPHKANNYRPHLIRVHGLIAVLVVALLAQVMYSFTTTGNLSVLGRVSDIHTVDLLAETNAEREKAGLSDLVINAQLSDAAYLKAQNMFAEQYWAHVSPSGTQPWKWFGDVGYNYSYAGENLAKNYPSSQATVNAWMGSPAHRDNILKGAYEDVGFAVVDGTIDGRPTTLVVALYGAPVTVAAVEAASSTRSADFVAPMVTNSGSNPVSYFGSALESLSPVTIVILGLLAVVAIVGVVAHHYRAKLPKAWKTSWRIHHGLYTFFGMITLGVLIIVATGGGSI